MINDGRSMKIVFLAHCILNSNAIAVGPKTPTIWPAMINEVLSFLMEKKVSIVQLPCPEQPIFGFIRGSQTKTDMDTSEYRKHCRIIAENVTNLVEGYIKNGFKVLCLVGKRGSPSCGVKKVWIRRNKEEVEVEGKGIFIEELLDEFRKKGLNIPFIDFERTEVEECLKNLDKLISES